MSTITDSVRLRPIVEADLPLLERLYDDPAEAGEFSFYGWNDPGGFRRRWTENRFISDAGGKLAVVRSDEFIGDVGWNRVPHGPASYCWNIGIGLLAHARGAGAGTRAHQLLVAYLFGHTQVNRLEAGTEIDNIAELRALEKAGFAREGVLRGANYRAGQWRDMVLYSLLRSEASW